MDINKKTVYTTNLNSTKEKSQNAIREIVKKIEVAKKNNVKFDIEEITDLIQNARDYYKYWLYEKERLFQDDITILIAFVVVFVVSLFLYPPVLINLSLSLLVAFVFVFFVKKEIDDRNICSYVKELFGSTRGNKRLKESVEDAIYAVSHGKKCEFDKKSAIKFLFIMYVVIISIFLLLQNKHLAKNLVLVISFVAIYFFWQKNWNIEIEEEEEQEDENDE